MVCKINQSFHGAFSTFSVFSHLYFPLKVMSSVQVTFFLMQTSVSYLLPLYMNVSPDLIKKFKIMKFLKLTAKYSNDTTLFKIWSLKKSEL